MKELGVFKATTLQANIYCCEEEFEIDIQVYGPYHLKRKIVKHSVPVIDPLICSSRGQPLVEPIVILDRRTVKKGFYALMAEHTPKSRINSGIQNINLVSDYAPSFNIGLTQEDVVKVVSNPIQSKKSKTPSPKDQKIKKYEKKRKAKEIEVDDDVQNSSADESEEDSKEEVVFKNIEPTQRKLLKFQIPEKDVLEDERSVNSDDEFQDPPPKQINQQYEDKDSDLQHMDYVGAETSPQRFSPNVDKNLYENLNGTKGCTDLHSDKTNVEIDFQYLIPDELLRNEILLSLNAYRRKSITTHPSTICAEETTDENLNDKKSKSVVEDDCQQIDVCFYYLRKKSKYEPNNAYKYSTVDCNFINIIRSVMDVYSVDDPHLNAGGQEAYLNEYINGFRIHAAVSWHTVEDIYISVNIKKKYHWVLAVLSFSERCIFLCDSYESSGHYAAVLAEKKKLAEIIPLCLQACNFYEKIGIDFQKHLRYKDKDPSDLFDVMFEDNLPRQPSGSLDCGLYMVTYAKCLSYGQRVSPIEFNPNVLRTRYTALLWDYGMRKQEANAHSDFEAPLRPVRQSRIPSVIEVFDVWWLVDLLNWIVDKLVYEYRFEL
ncbi:hypothetical protein CQW23_03565 [Capsicum baccatum]|uniref:Ubiquitin-like protease family profile domain-containing protein n=1 Tax=Capsicum baccatum TaxID=33114 RepID=A0A2G2XCA0_CAPBA|nr:hypothetical protein CQW23_03565 [Capsicum baccatum]